MIGVRADGAKELIAIDDGAVGFWKALRNVFADTKEQRCWWNKIGNVFAALPKAAHKGRQGRAGGDLRREVAQSGREEPSGYGSGSPREPARGPPGSRMAFKLIESAQLRWRAVNSRWSAPARSSRTASSSNDPTNQQAVTRTPHDTLIHRP
jgi:hypothetical protein